MRAQSPDEQVQRLWSDDFASTNARRAPEQTATPAVGLACPAGTSIRASSVLAPVAARSTSSFSAAKVRGAVQK